MTGILIIGGGLTGLQLAKDLADRGVAGVVLLESGPGGELTHINRVYDPATALGMWVEPHRDPYFWRPWQSKSEPHYAGTAGLRRRLGGRSLYWHGVTLPLEPWALCEPWWPADVIRDLTVSWRGGPSLYDRVGAELAAWRAAGGNFQPADDLPLGPYVLRETPQAARGIAAGGERWDAYTPAEHFADGGTPSVRVLTRMEVLGVLVRDGAAAGALVRDESGAVREITADRTVLAAGTIENTRLVAQAWREVDADAPTVFEGLVDHITQGFVAALDPASVDPKLVALADRDSFFVTPAAPETRSNLFLRLYRNAREAVVVDVWTMGEQMPGPESAVHCVPTAELPWTSYVRAGLLPEDRALVRAQRAELTAFWSHFSDGRALPAFPDYDNPARTLEQVMPGIDGAGPDTPPATWSGPLGSEYHEASTLPMGGVTTGDHEVAAIPRLYVTGPATFPRIGAANPSLTSLALVRRLAGSLSATVRGESK
jgi:choline dehydrogenase-like flavoprotein